MKKLLYCVYVLYSLKDLNFYIGYTTNLNQRLTSYIHGNSLATEMRRPFTLLFCEYFLSKHDATRREKYFKTTAGKKTLRIVLKESLEEINLIV
ncbi:MAG: GIY-YIG nuclease family protein [Candidatus Roizmanbacteria bacterium]|nr:MAG: GIY-YIG nuclease family protein [Candidatus Roizmanbacteria bacterium]